MKWISIPASYTVTEIREAQAEGDDLVRTLEREILECERVAYGTAKRRREQAMMFGDKPDPHRMIDGFTHHRRS